MKDAEVIDKREETPKRPRLLTLKQCAERGLKRTTLYKNIRQGALIARKVGRATLVLEADLETFIVSLPKMQPKSGSKGQRAVSDNAVLPLRAPNSSVARDA